MLLQAGTRVGPYEVAALLGEGGMGEVWLATELRLGRKVALKLLPGDFTRGPFRIERFEQEARAASALNHPNVCTIYALDQTSEGQVHLLATRLLGRHVGIFPDKPRWAPDGRTLYFLSPSGTVLQSVGCAL